MKKETNRTPVTINLISTARSSPDEPDLPMQLLTTGELEKRPDASWVLRYTETQEDEETGEPMKADVTLLMKKDRVIMHREGAFRNTMVFVRGQRFEGLYSTPFGDLPMAVYTHRMSCDVEKDRGSVTLHYQLDMQGAYASTNELHLNFVT